MWDKEVSMNDDSTEHPEYRCCVARAAAKYFTRAVSVVLILLSLSAFAADEETLGVLQVGEQTYQNVKVRTRAKDYILIVHSSGLTSIKVRQLPAELLQRLGYDPAAMAKGKTNNVAAVTRASIAKGEAFVEGVEAKLSDAWRGSWFASKVQQLTTLPTLAAVAAVLLMAHLFCSYCFLLICRKTGNRPGMLVWLPLLQAIPVLRAASMSTRWFGALFVPGLNLVAYVLWSVKIVEARQKTMPLAILLLFPLTSWFAFLFLAFSQDSRTEGKKVHVENMTLQTVCTSRARDWTRVLMEREQHIVA
jgi:hypothetical protein